jgi:hypothetical protein
LLFFSKNIILDIFKIFKTIICGVQKVHKELKELGCFSKVNILVDTTCPEDLSPPKYQVRNKAKKVWQHIQKFSDSSGSGINIDAWLEACMLGLR